MREPRDRPGEIALVEGSVPPGVGLRELISESEVVFYMAGTSTPESASLDPGASIANHIVPAAAVLDLMCDTPTRRIVVASSGGTVYGAAMEFPTPEDHPTRPISLHGHHSLTIERYARFFAERYAICGDSSTAWQGPICTYAEHIWNEDGQQAGPVAEPWNAFTNLAPSFFVHLPLWTGVGGSSLGSSKSWGCSLTAF